MTNVETRRSVGFRLRRVRERLGWDRTELADKLGVHPGSIARWETGGSVPHRYHLERIAEWGDVDPNWIVTGEEQGAGDEPASTRGEEEDAEELFASFDSIARFLGGIGPAGQEKLRKLDALEGLRRMLTAKGLLPDWWYELRDRIEGDEL
ncbi:MAG TPA: helix-turn-helix transcriptional regulator [Longimicrobiaceae bacterium]|nr:helix-turn-helix transcriptional regulator [Longimicrobiaceae bacterium]